MATEFFQTLYPAKNFGVGDGVEIWLELKSGAMREVHARTREFRE
jgi:hypothetical protein